MTSARAYESDLDYRDDPLIVLENDHLLAAFDPAHGGRCTTLLDKAAAIDFVAMNRWQEPGIGLLDDFNGNGLYPAPFRATLVSHECRSGRDGVELILKTVERRYKTVPMDVRLTKRVRLAHVARALQVTYELSNHTRRALTLDLNVCNFIQPWGEEMQIVVPVPGGLRVEKSRAGWQLFREENLSGGWCAAFGPRSGRGLRIGADFALVKAWSAFARGGGFSIDLDTFLFRVAPGKSLRLALSVMLLDGCFEPSAAAPANHPLRAARRGDPSSVSIAQGLPVAAPYLEKLARRKPPPHPRLFFSRAELEGLRLPRQHPVNQALRARVLEVADRLLRPRKGRDAPASNAPFYLGYAWLLTGREPYFRAARRWLLRSAAGKEGDPISRAILYDWLYEKLSRSERRQVREADLARLRHSYATYVSAAGHHPRGLMGTGMKRHCPNPFAWAEVLPFGFAGLAYGDELPDAAAWVEYARRTSIGFLEYFNEEVGRDGEYFEGSCYYYAFMPTFIAFLEALERVTGEEIFKAHPWLRKNAEWNVFCSIAGREMIPFGDSSIARWWLSVRHAAFLYLLARRYRNGSAQFAADQQSKTFLQWWGGGEVPPAPKRVDSEDFAVWADLWRDEELQSQRLSDPLTRHFRGCGWAVLREGFEDDDLVIALQGWKTVGHSHGTQGHFVVLGGPEFLITDPGYILASPFHTARWHNLVTFDGKEQFDWDAEHFQGSPAGGLQWVGSDAELEHFMADLTMNYRGQVYLYQRHLFYLRPRTVVVIDDARASQERRINYYLQCAGRPRRVGKAFRFSHKGQNVSLDLLTASRYSWKVCSRADGYRPQHALAIAWERPTAHFLSALVIQAPRDGRAAEVSGNFTPQGLTILLDPDGQSRILRFTSAQVRGR